MLIKFYTLTHFFPMFPFDPLEKLRKPKVKDIGKERVKKDVFQIILILCF